MNSSTMEDDTDQEIRDYYLVNLRLRGYIMHRMPNDENSLYHAIAAGALGHYGTYVRKKTYAEQHAMQMDVRKKIQQYILKQEDTFLEYVEVDPSITNEEEKSAAIKAKVLRIHEDKFQGGQESIAAASAFFKRTILVDQPLEPPLEYKYVGCKDKIVISCVTRGHFNLLEKRTEKRSTEEAVLKQHFEEYLKLKKLKLVKMDELNNPFNALARVFKGNGDRFAEVRKEMHDFLQKNKKTFKIKVMNWIQKNKPTRHGYENALKVFVNDMSSMTAWTEDFINILASQCFKRAIVVERPLFQPINYLYQEGGLLTCVRLCRPKSKHYDCLEEEDPNQNEVELELDDDGALIGVEENVDDDVIFVDPTETKDSEDSSELLYIKSKVYQNIRSKVTVVFLVPIKELTHDTLFDVLENEKPKYIKHLVVYNSDDLNKLKRDADIRNVFTMYSHTFKGTLRKTLLRRITRLALYLLPPLLLTVKKATCNGILLESMCKFSPNSFPMILLTQSWKQIKDEVIADFEKLASNKGKLLCYKCESDCNLKNVTSHFNPRKFIRTGYEKVKHIKFGQRFDIFATKDQGVPPVVQKIREVFNSPATKSVDDLLEFLDLPPKKQKKFATYLVLHVDGPNMQKYTDDSTYYQMLNDPTTIKSIYVGKSTDSAFRYSHFVHTSSLSKIFSSTSKLIMLRSIKFETPCEAKRDEAIMIEIITTFLESWSERRKDPNFLFLNINSECMQLLQECNTTNPDIWAEFAASNIPVINTDPNNKEKFTNNLFNGNFKKEYELEVLSGGHSKRNFEDLAETYLEIKARQP